MKTKTTAKGIRSSITDNDTGRNQQRFMRKKEYTIGIEQFAEHGSLDNCREAFLEGLKEEGD